jgi:hypothetical protein
MKEKIALLLAVLDQGWSAVERLWKDLDARAALVEPTEDQTVATAYLLHNLYTALEDLLKQVARTFENELEEPSRYHADLLNRMALDIYKTRPAFLSAPSLRALQELRKFRHVFRHAYDFVLDAARVSELARLAQASRPQLQADKSRFRAFLLQVLEEPADSPPAAPVGGPVS